MSSLSMGYGIKPTCCRKNLIIELLWGSCNEAQPLRWSSKRCEFYQQVQHRNEEKPYSIGISRERHMVRRIIRTSLRYGNIIAFSLFIDEESLSRFEKIDQSATKNGQQRWQKMWNHFGRIKHGNRWFCPRIKRWLCKCVNWKKSYHRKWAMEV